MFNIFKSKDFPFSFGNSLKVDMHSHVLPGIDDGAPDLEHSLSLIDGLVRSGYERLIATPHIMSDHWPNTPDTINNALNELRTALNEKGYTITVNAAAEYMLDENFEKLVKEDQLLTMGNKMILVETYFQNLPPNFTELIFQLQVKGYQVILAHPERYHYFDNKFLSDMKDSGVLLQANALSFTGYYGRKEKEHAEKMLQDGLLDLVGTDLHHQRHLEALEGTMLTKKVIEQLEIVNNSIHF